MDKLPIELLHKIFLYKIPPPHYFAYKTGIRIITSNELNCKISGYMKILTDEEIELQEEYEDFLEAGYLFNDMPYNYHDD
tara:strand:- start:531 stop:770 length:240 start_codon:yes stop_codon:yes gene_type:complete